MGSSLHGGDMDAILQWPLVTVITVLNLGAIYGWLSPDGMAPIHVHQTGCHPQVGVVSPFFSGRYPP